MSARDRRRRDSVYHQAERSRHELHAGAAWRRNQHHRESGGHKAVAARNVSTSTRPAGITGRCVASEATQWLPYGALATMFVGVLDTLLRPPGMLRALVWICYCAGLLRLLLSPKFQYGWSLLEGVFWIAGLALGMLVLASFLDAAVRRDKSVSSLLILTIVACGTGVALMLSGSALLGQMAIVLIAALGAILVVTFLFPKSIEGRAIVPVAVSILASLWLMGFFYAELPSASALLLAAALLPGCLLISFSESTAFSWKPILLRAGVVLALVAISVVIAFRSSPPL